MRWTMVMLAGLLLACGESGPTGQVVSPAEDVQGTEDAATADPPIQVPGAGARSGSRLKRQFLMADDGSRHAMPYSIWDSKLQTNCQFAFASDGVQRCLPVSTAGASGSYFADPNCVEPAFFTTECVASSGFVRDPVPGDCDSTKQSVHTWPEQPLDPDTIIYFEGSDGCEPHPGVSTNWTWWKLGPEIPPEEFVAATIETEE